MPIPLNGDLPVSSTSLNMENLLALVGIETSTCLVSDQDAADLSKHEQTFIGVEGATSLKAEIIGRVPTLNDASHYRVARKLLLDLGGAVMLRNELTYSGFVHPTTFELTVNDKPFNIFARLAAGVQHQPSAALDQEALGPFKNKFIICSNRHENDIHWDSEDPKWIRKASMARRHRFLTTRSLHWQWFNPLVFGLVPADEEGVSVQEALKEVEDMKAAALHYAKHIGGWSDQVGLFVNVFGHNSVNSLFVHILDMSELGPGFAFQSFKNLPFDNIIKVLREECASKTAATTSLKGPALPGFRQNSKTTRSSTRGVKFFFAGTDGATSVKAEIIGRIPVLKEASSYRAVRRMLLEEFGGIRTLKEELCRFGFIDNDTGLLTTGTNPFNVFARVVAGLVKQPGMEEEQQHLGNFQDEFMICSNRPENDDHWDSEDPEWVGKASMSRRHRFLTVKDLHWQWFNALAFGLVPESENGVSLKNAIEKVERMKAAALQYASACPGWSKEVGLFCHVFGHNSVNSLHVHILDMAHRGPTFWKYEYKNCELDTILKVLKEELLVEQSFSSTSTQLAKAITAIYNESDETIKDNRSLEKAQSDILTVNVGGQIISVARATMLLAPPRSLLHETFRESSQALTHLDENHHPFLDFPPVAFCIIADHLRLLRLTPSTETLPARKIPADLYEEVSSLSWLLGVDDLLFKNNRGRADPGGYIFSGKTTTGLRPFCCARRRHVVRVECKSLTPSLEVVTSSPPAREDFKNNISSDALLEDRL